MYPRSQITSTLCFEVQRKNVILLIELLRHVVKPIVWMSGCSELLYNYLIYILVLVASSRLDPLTWWLKTLLYSQRTSVYNMSSDHI